MRIIANLGIGLALFLLSSCGQVEKKSSSEVSMSDQSEKQLKNSCSNSVVETIMARRSIRKYKPTAIENEKLAQILACGVNAPNGMYKQSWELRVVKSQKVMGEIEKSYTDYLSKNGAKKISHPSYGAPCLIFIAYDTSYDLSQVDCGLLGENLILAAQSMGLGTCCLGGIVRFMNSPEAAGLLNRLDLPSSYKLLYAIAVGYPDENPSAKPRDMRKIKYIE